jgi:hypothetical protein
VTYNEGGRQRTGTKGDSFRVRTSIDNEYESGASVENEQ